MRSIWFGIVIVLTIIGVSTSAFAVPIYVVDDYKSSWGINSSRIIVMDSDAPHNEIILNAGTGRRITDIAVTPGGFGLYTITGDGYASLYRYDVNDGRLLNSWNLGIGGTGFKNALAAEGETSLLLMSNDKTSLWRINLDDAGNFLSTTVVADIGRYSSGDLAISPDGTIYFSAVDWPNSLTAKNRLYTINLSSDEPVVTEIGIIHEIGRNPQTNWLTQIYGLAFDEHGVLYAGRGAFGVAADVYTINLLDAGAAFAWTMQDKLPAGINGFASAPFFTNIPEPAALLLLTLGTALIRIKRK
ncbi:MAG: PEP-CTERM sorting domain-containing protein [Sedimentisphaerales bacterium]|nr:PEP-CTERM sorting domain-containing protein [Sedimentisphaerales bacterium]